MTAPSIVTGKRRAERGFTIIELMVVMTIIVTLATIAMVQYRQSVQFAKESVLKDDLFKLRDAIDQYYADKNQYPPTLDDLVSAAEVVRGRHAVVPSMVSPGSSDVKRRAEAAGRRSGGGAESRAAAAASRAGGPARTTWARPRGGDPADRRRAR